MSVSLFHPVDDLAPDDAPAASNEDITGGDELAAVLPDSVQLPNPTAAELRQLALTAIEQASLPRGLRAVLAEAFDEQLPVVVDQGRTLLPLDRALQALEKVIPSGWLADPKKLAEMPHPLGNGFFEGNHDALTDERAAAIAEAQLQRAGYLPAA